MGERRIAIVVMGPSGTGKTTVAKALADHLGWRFAEADEFHPPENIAKMSAGIPLDDHDRQPWLERIRDFVTAEAKAGRDVVLTCSALKRRYRDTLREAGARVRFLLLDADPAVIAERLRVRKGHYMPPSLLESQYRDLERLTPDEDGAVVDVNRTAEAVVETALRALELVEPRTLAG